MVARFSLFTLAVLLAGFVPVYSFAAPQKPLAVCLDSKTGAAIAKAKCNPKKETRFVPADTQTRGGSGLNVYDSTGRLIGPLIGLDETVVEINGAKYAAPFQRDSIGYTQPYLFYPEPDCGGIPIIRADYHFSGLGSLHLFVRTNNLYITSGIIPDARYQSYQRWNSNIGSVECITGGHPNYPSPFTFGVSLTEVGPITSTFPPPFDVR